MSTSRPKLWAAACVLPVCLLLAGGCAPSRTVKGKVVVGPAGVATVVAPNDPRLGETGEAGVRVRIAEGEGPGAIAEATSSADGTFTLRVPDDMMSSRLGIHVSGEEIMPLHASAYLPADQRRLLVLVERKDSMDAEEH